MPNPTERASLKTNLRYLCQFHRSVSVVAREIGINRQQFEKYVSGASYPSAHSRRKIGDYFDIDPERLSMEPTAFREVSPDLGHRQSLASFDLPEATHEELTALRPYIGFYQSYFLTPAWPGWIYVALVRIFEDDRKIRTVFFNRARDPKTNEMHRSRLDGVITLRGERLFLLEKTRHEVDRISETILYTSHKYARKYLTGMSIGVTWRPHRAPFATRLMWRRVHVLRPIRDIIAECGIYRPEARVIDPIVRDFFGSNPLAYTMNDDLSAPDPDEFVVNDS